VSGYSWIAVGKLEDIIARNRDPKRFGERMTVGIGLGVFLLIILFLVVCTDLGKHPDADKLPASIRPIVASTTFGSPEQVAGAARCLRRAAVAVFEADDVIDLGRRHSRTSVSSSAIIR